MATKQGPVERRLRAELRKAGWTANDAGPAATAAAQAIDLAQTIDRTTAARDKSTLHRELRMVLHEFRSVSEPVEGDAVDDAAGDDLPGRGAGAPDPGAVGGGNVLPFGGNRSSAR